MQDAAAARDAKKGFEMARVVPHHGGHTVAGLHAKFRQRAGEPPRTPIELAVTSANDGPVRLTGDDFYTRKDFSGPLQDGWQSQGKIHHGAAHRASRTG